MKIQNVLLEYDILLLREMDERSLQVVVHGIIQEGKKKKIQIVPTAHFVNDRLLDQNDSSRADISPRDLFRTVQAFLNKFHERLKILGDKKLNVDFVIHNERTNLNVVMGFKGQESFGSHGTRYKMTLVTAKLDSNYRSEHFNNTRTVKINV